MLKRTDKPPPSLPDPEAILFSRLVERVLQWPCVCCGRRGLCECWASSPISTDAPTADADRAVEAEGERRVLRELGRL
jgi:hypothetical protein